MSFSSLFQALKKVGQGTRSWIILPLFVFLAFPYKAFAVAPIVAAAVPVVTGIAGFLAKAVTDFFVDGAASLGVLAVSVGIISYIAFSIAKFLLWVAAMVFNWAMQTMVFGFAEIFGNSQGLLLAWSTLRDFGNILLLFGFITIGIRMILNVDHHGAGKTLPQLIIFAILINFSLFAAQAVVDVSNGLTYGFYTQSTGSLECQGVGEEGKAECQLNNGIAGQILNQLNIISVVSGASGYNVDLAGDVASYFSNPVSSTITFIMLAILVSLAAVVLFAGAFLLLTRGITLVFLMVLSPIGFAGMAIPALNDAANKWWSALINNAIFAPVFIILLFVGLRVSDGLKSLVQVEGGLGTAVVSGNSLAAGPIFMFLLVLGFLIAALLIGKKFSIAGAGFAINSASALTYGAMTRGTNLAGGMMALNARRFIQSNPALRDRKGLQVLTNRFLRPLEKANLDLRRAGLGAALKAGGVTSGAEAAEHATLGDLRHMYDDAKAGKESKKLEKEYQGEISMRKLEDNIHHGGLSEENKKKLAGMSAEKLAAMHATQDVDPSSAAGQEYAETLSSQQFDGLMNLKEGFDDEQKANLRKARFAKIDAGNTAGVKGLSKEDLEAMPASTFMKESTLLALNDAQRTAVENSSKFSPQQKDAVKSHTEAKIFERDLGRATTPAQEAAVVARISTMDQKQVAELSVRTLTRPDVVQQFNKSILSKIQAGGKLRNKNDIQAVANAIRINNPTLGNYISNPQSPAHEFWN